MISALLQKKLVRTAAALAAVGAIAGVVAGGSPAQADPQQYTAPIFGFGSDTLQDITNAFAGYSNGVNFTPLQTSASTGNRQIVSWDAFPANSCISPKVGGPTILRPNGSTNGTRIISAAFSPAADTWPFGATALCGGAKNPQGLVDFGRSSSAPATVDASGALTYIPWGRDALSIAYLRPSGGAIVSITAADVITLHSTGPQLIGGVPVIACGIQTGSGTYSSWMTALGLANPGGDNTGTALCNDAGGVPDVGGRLQENNGPDLLAKGPLLSSMMHPICDGVAGGVAVSCENAQLIVGFSASQYIARSNGVGTPAPNLEGNPAISGLGRIDGQQAVSGTIPNLVPVEDAYNSTTFGRDVYYVVPYENIDTVNFTAIPHLVEMFVGPTSDVCSASSTIQQHGFLPITNCGDTTLRAPFRTS
ncbi:MAG TPA: hypothetical protein VMM60_04370 [Ilumatobacter sp.]|nr:hypothetical protein [Ilumatobacter sp.]